MSNVKIVKTKKSAQDIQDEIFQKMSVNKKLELGAKLWQLGKELDSNKINYARHRSKKSFDRNRKNS